MDIYAIRAENLSHLVDDLRNPENRGNKVLLKEVALELDMSPSFLSQLLGGKRMGDEVARKIERHLLLPFGFMDMPGEKAIEAEEARRALDPDQEHWTTRTPLDSPTLSAALRLVRLASQNIGLALDLEQDADPLVFAYGYIEDHRARDVTPELLIEFSRVLRERKQSSDRGRDGDH